MGKTRELGDYFSAGAHSPGSKRCSFSGHCLTRDRNERTCRPAGLVREITPEPDSTQSVDTPPRSSTARSRIAKLRRPTRALVGPGASASRLNPRPDSPQPGSSPEA